MRTLFTILLLSCFAGHIAAQNIVDVFWGVKFGSDKATAKDIIQRTKKLLPDRETEDALFYKPGTFGEHGCSQVFLFFVDRRFTAATVYYPATPETVFDLYHSISGAIRKKYGEPTASEEKYMPPYHKGDGDEIKAIKAKHAKIRTSWNSDSSDENYITVAIYDNLSVVLTYWSSVRK